MSTYSGIKVKDPALEQHFTQGELRSYKSQFDSIQPGTEQLTPDDLKHSFSKLGFEQPLEDEEVQGMMAEFDVGKSGQFDFEAFLRLQLDLENGQSKFSAKASPRKTSAKRAFLRCATSTIMHTLNDSESKAYIEHVNHFLANDKHIGKSLPLDPENTDELLDLTKKGVLLCKLINIAQPGTIDERAVNFKENPNPWERIENHTLALNSARAIGCSVVNIGTEDLAEAKPHLVLGLIAQIVKVQLLGRVSVKATPELVQLMDEQQDLEESFIELLTLSSEAMLLRWMNYHLKKAGYKKTVNNFSSDVKDGEAYTYLLHRLEPTMCDLSPLQVEGQQRAVRLLQQAERLGCWKYIQPKDIAEGSPNLNLAFVANLFQTRNGLVVEEAKLQYVERLGGEVLESPELKSFRMWINSLGISIPGGSLIQALRDGSVLLQIIEKLQPGSVKSSSRTPGKSPLKATFVKLERCAKAVKIGKEMKLSMVGIAGDDIVAGNKKLILGFLWQLLRFHMFALLQSLAQSHEVSDDAILQWANQRVQAAGKGSRMESFKDRSLANGLFFLDLLSAVEPRAVNYSLVKRGESDEDDEQNANYMISVARKMGCTIFLSAEDIVEVRPKMMMMLAASIMHFELSKTMSKETRSESQRDETKATGKGGEATKVVGSTNNIIIKGSIGALRIPQPPKTPELFDASNNKPSSTREPSTVSNSPSTATMPKMERPLLGNFATPSKAPKQVGVDSASVSAEDIGKVSDSPVVPTTPKVELLGSSSFVTPVKGLQHFGVKLKPTPPRT